MKVTLYISAYRVGYKMTKGTAIETRPYDDPRPAAVANVLIAPTHSAVDVSMA